MLYSGSSLVSYFIRSECMSVPIRQFLPLQPPPLSILVSIHLFSRSGSLFLLYKKDCLYHVSRFHLYVLSHDICCSPFDADCLINSTSHLTPCLPSPHPQLLLQPTGPLSLSPDGVRINRRSGINMLPPAFIYSSSN